MRMGKESLVQLIKDRLAEVRQRRQGIPQDDLSTVFQYVRAGLAEQFSSGQISDSDLTQTGEGSPKEAYERLRARASEDGIVTAIIDMGGTSNLLGHRIDKVQYEKAVKSILESLSGNAS